MKNINLKDQNISKKKKNVGATVTLSTILLIVVFLIYGVVFGLNMMTKKSVAKVEQEIKNIKSTFTSDEYRDVYKFGIKLVDLKDLIGGKGFLPITEDIVKISDKTLSEVRFSALNTEIEGGVAHYTAELVIPDKETLAKQVRIYKEDEKFSNVFLAGVGRDENDDLKADLNFDIGQSKPQPTSESTGLEENF